MKISRRSVLRYTGLTAAWLALTGCAPTGNATLGSGLPAWIQKLLNRIPSSSVSSSAASSEVSSVASSAASAAASSEAAASSDIIISRLPDGEQLDPGFGVMPNYDANPLTGELRQKDTRIVGVMVNNICNSEKQNARPQRGIGSADLLIESKVEGGITRFCAVYSDVNDIPEIGPIRSGRDQFLQLLMPWQALYYHDGESIFCTQFINVYKYSDLNIGGKNYFNTPVHPHVAHRIKRSENVAYEHTEFTSAKEIQQAASNAGIRLDYAYEDTFFRFADYRTSAVSELEGEPSARNISITHSASYKTSFAYNSWGKNYKMSMYSHRTKKFESSVDELTNKQLTFDNVVVCFANIAAYAGDSHDVQEVQYVQGGEAYLFTRGGVQTGHWEKNHPTQALKLYTDSGEEMILNRGKTYFALVDDDEWSNFSYQ